MYGRGHVTNRGKFGTNRVTTLFLPNHNSNVTTDLPCLVYLPRHVFNTSV